MGVDAERRDPFRDLYSDDIEALERYKAHLSMMGSAGAAGLFAELVGRYEKLLGRAIQLTRVSDTNESHLMASRQHLQEEVDKVQQLSREKSRFLSVASHDLRSPLGAVSNILRLLDEDVDGAIPDEDRRVLLRDGRETIDRMVKLIGDLLNVDEMDSGEFKVRVQHCNLNDLIERGAQTYLHSAEKKAIDIYLDLPSPDHVCATDPGAFERIFDNLISNAVKYSNQGGRIWIRLLNGSEGWVVEVEDEGPGILPDEMPRLFKRYSKLSNKPTGEEPSTGLGLSIAHGLAEALGYRLCCDSEVGRGSCFRLLLGLGAGSDGEALPAENSQHRT